MIGLVAIGVIVGGLFWLGNRGQPGGNGEIIAAPEGDYKVRPENPGGMNVAGEGDTASPPAKARRRRAISTPMPSPEQPVDADARPSAGMRQPRLRPRRRRARPRARAGADHAPARAGARRRRRHHPARRLLEPGRREQRLDRACRPLPLPRAARPQSSSRCRSAAAPSTACAPAARTPPASAAACEIAGEDCSVVS